MSTYVRQLMVIAAVCSVLTGTVSASAQETSLCTVAQDRGVSSTAVIDNITDWSKQYPDSLSDDKIIALDGRDCRLCHAFVNSGYGWNAYGWALRQNDQNPVTQEQNSDEDPGGYSNLTEITAHAQPGWTTGENIVYYRNGTTSTVSAPELTPLDAGSRETTPPTGSIVINAGAQYTKRAVVTLSLEASDNGGSGVFKGRFRSSGNAWGAWEEFAANKTWTLPAGDGDKRLLFQVKDWAGNESDVVSDTIKLDTKAPAVTLTSHSSQRGYLRTLLSKCGGRGPIHTQASIHIRSGTVRPIHAPGATGRRILNRAAATSRAQPGGPTTLGSRRRTELVTTAGLESARRSSPITKGPI